MMYVYICSKDGLIKYKSALLTTPFILKEKPWYNVRSPKIINSIKEPYAEMPNDVIPRRRRTEMQFAHLDSSPLFVWCNRNPSLRL